MRTKPYVVSNEDGFRAFRLAWSARRAFREEEEEEEEGKAILAFFDRNNVQHILDTNVSREAPTELPKTKKGQSSV
jgi:hypothetical protein